MPKPKRLRPSYRAMIVAPQPEAVEAGLGLLAAGGNALDAVVSCALTQGVVDPMMCGIGGLGVLQIFDPGSGKISFSTGSRLVRPLARRRCGPTAFERECSDGYGYVLTGGVNELGHCAVTTPGIMRVFGDAHAAFGKLPWAELFAPAIGHAEGGWVVRPHVATMFALDEAGYGRLPYVNKLALTPDGRSLYLRPDGTPKRVGDGVRNPDLASTLRDLARDGAKSFYEGELAQRICDDMRNHGGLLTLEDLAGFKARSRMPLKVGYRGRIIATPPPPAGGVMVAQMLRILERFDLVAHEHNGAPYVRMLAEAMKIAGRDKDLHIGDPDFVPPPLERLLSTPMPRNARRA